MAEVPFKTKSNRKYKTKGNLLSVGLVCFGLIISGFSFSKPLDLSPFLPLNFASTFTSWFKASDASSVTSSTNGANVTLWSDVSTTTGPSGDLSTASGTAPIYIDDETGVGVQNLNFNPVIDFNTSNSSRLTIANNTDYNSGGPYSNKSINVVFRTDSDITTRQVIYEQGGGARGINLYIFNNSLYATAWNRNNDGAGAPWNNGGSSLNTVSIGISANQAYMATIELRGNSSLTGTFVLYLDGVQVGTLSGIGLLYTHNNAVFMGYTNQTLFENLTTTAGFSFEGQIGEFIYENEPSIFTNRPNIESYLALKYGLTLDQSTSQNYVNSNGAIVWNGTTNGSYNNDIAGVGRDDDSELLQLISRSSNDNSVVTIEKEVGFATDQSFLIWGNDGSANTETTADLPSIGSITQRISKEWRVDEEVDVGPVNISFDLSELTIAGSTTDPNQFNLLVTDVSSGGSFASATIIGNPTISGDIVTFSGVDLNDGEYFALGTASTLTNNPGGVTGVDLWLKANDGAINTGDGSNVTSWESRTVSNYNLSDAGASPYVFRSTGLNFNPTVDNDNGSDRRLESTSAITLQTVYLVTIPNSPDNCDNPFSERAVDDEGIRTCGAAPNGWGIDNDANDFAEVSTGGLFWFNGLSVSTDPLHNNTPNILTVQAPVSASIANGIELGDSNLGRFWHGDIAEVIGYNGTQIFQDRNRIESYLALKYGITLDQTTATNYVDARGNVIWNATTNSTFNDGIAGIGRDDDSGLEQKQSRSIDSDAILTIGHVSIASSNVLNTNAFTNDLDFLIWGHDGASTAGGVLELPATVTQRMNRKWRVDKTGDVDNVTVSFDLNGLGFSTDPTDFSLLINNTADMSSASIISGGVFVGDEIRFSNVNFNDGDYFSLGTVRSITFGPGGKTDALTSWLKADATTTVTTSTDGANVSLWEDSFIGLYDFSTGTTTPTYNDNDAESMNFNQNVDFVRASSDGLNTADNNDYNLTGSFFTRKGIQMAFRTSSDITNRQVIYEQGGGTRGLNIYIRNGELHISAWNRSETAPLGNWNNSGNVTSVSTPIGEDQSYVLSFELDGDDNTDGNGVANGSLNLYLDGRLIGSIGSIGVLYNHGGDIGMGYSNGGTYFDNGNFGSTGEYFNGAIAEFIYSNEPDPFNAGQRNQTESYLAIKYGVTLDQSTPQNYTNSSGGVIWNAATNGVYNNAIAGIGRDDISILSQLKSKSANDDAIVTMEFSSAIANDNTWLIWANDDVALEGTEADGNTDFNRIEGIFSRLFREWRVQETNNLGTVEVTFDVSNIDNVAGIGTNDLTALRLMVDNDGIFANGATYFSPTSVNNILNTATFQVNFTSGQFFTLGSIDANALPVDLLQFDAQLTESSKVELKWSTASESDNDFFNIEHSFDGQHFKSIGLVAGVGNSTVQNSYTFVHNHPNNGFNYYRLRQNDLNGDFEYSWIESVYFESAKAFEAKLFPNPVRQGEVFNLDLNALANDDLKISIYNAKGRVIKVMSSSDFESDRMIKLNTKGFNKGLHMIRIHSNNGASQVIKLLVH